MRRCSTAAHLWRMWKSQLQLVESLKKSSLESTLPPTMCCVSLAQTGGLMSTKVFNPFNQVLLTIMDAADVIEKEVGKSMEKQSYRFLHHRQAELAWKSRQFDLTKLAACTGDGSAIRFFSAFVSIWSMGQPAPFVLFPPVRPRRKIVGSPCLTGGWNGWDWEAGWWWTAR